MAATVSYVDPTVLILTTPDWLGVKAYQTVLWTGTLHDGIGSPPAVSTVDSRTDCVGGLKGSDETTVALAKLSFEGGAA